MLIQSRKSGTQIGNNSNSWYLRGVQQDKKQQKRTGSKNVSAPKTITNFLEKHYTTHFTCIHGTSTFRVRSECIGTAHNTLTSVAFFRKIGWCPWCWCILAASFFLLLFCSWPCIYYICIFGICNACYCSYTYWYWEWGKKRKRE